MDTPDSERPTRPIPSPTVVGFKAVGTRRAKPPIDLFLDGRALQAPSRDLLDASNAASSGGAGVTREEVERALAEKIKTPAEGVFVCAGVEDAIERVCRSRLGPGREIVIPEPTVERFRRVARLTGARVRVVPWMGGAYPSEAVLEGVSDETAVIVVVSPNDPTGAVVSRADLLRLSAQAPKALLVVLLRGIEFADDDISATAFRLPNAIAICAFSCALGASAERIAYAVGPPDAIDQMRDIGFPEPLSTASLVAALRCVEHVESVGSGLLVEEIRHEREQIAGLLARLGARAYASQADFILGQFPDARWTQEALEGMGIAVASFEDRAGLADCLRIRCPGSAAAARRLERAFVTVLDPGLFLFSLEDVLVDVSDSTSQAIREALASWGVAPLAGELRHLRRSPGGSDIVAVTRELLARHDVSVDGPEISERLAEIRARDSVASYPLSAVARASGLDCLQRLAARSPLGVVTRRPGSEAEAILGELGLRKRFDLLVSLEGAGPEQSPRGLIATAMKERGLETAWFVSGGADDLSLAREAGLLPVAYLSPPADAVEQSLEARAEVENALISAGAFRVIADLCELESWI